MRKSSGERPLSGQSIFSAASYGAAGTGRVNDSGAIQAAVDACAAAGGGIAYLPPGTYLAGSIRIKDNVTLYLERGVTLVASTEKSDYRDANLVYAEGAHNVGLAGPGRLYGQGPAFWLRWEREATELLKREGVLPPTEEVAEFGPDAGPGPAFWPKWHEIRPRHPGLAGLDWRPMMVNFTSCREVTVEGVFIDRSPGSAVCIWGCDSVSVRGLRIWNTVLRGPNTDGVGVYSSTNVTVSDCNVSVGDDSMVIKTGWGADRSRPAPPCRNVSITNCILYSQTNGFKIGTETESDIENIVFGNSVVYCHTDVPFMKSGIDIATVDGGNVRGVVISNVAIKKARTPLFIRRGARFTGSFHTEPGTLREVYIDNVVATGGKCTSFVTGLPGYDVEDVRLSGIRISTEGGQSREAGGIEVPERPRAYPDSTLHGELPAYALYCRHVRGLTLRDLRVDYEREDGRPLLVADDVKELDIDGLSARQASGQTALLRLVGTDQAFVRGCRAPRGTGVFLRAEGERTGTVTVMGNDLSCARTAVEADLSVPKGAVLATGNRTS